KMIYANSQVIGKQVEIIDTTDAERNQFSLSDDEIKELAKQAMIIEKHYQRPMDIEWAKDGIDGKLYIVQARPETVCSQSEQNVIERYELNNKADILIEGRAIGQRIGSGTVRLVDSLDQMSLVKEGDVLVTDMTDPDWEPVMKKAAAIVTNRGGRTCHAAIIARELGIPAIVGCGNATSTLTDGATVTVSCAEGETGYVYQGLLD
ncbi:PEP-utilizing enzyme, partial [Vibrio alginolyticus]